MFQYKANLDILNYRYTDLERQLLRAFIRRWQNARQALGQPQQAAGATRPQQIELSDMAQLAGVGRIRIYEPMTWAFTNLLDDGLIEFRDVSHFRTLLDQESTMVSRPVELTAKGCDFVVHWAAAQPLE